MHTPGHAIAPHPCTAHTLSPPPADPSPALAHDPDRCHALGLEITRLVGHGNALDHRLLTLIAEFDARAGWSDGFTRSCAHWLAWQCGLDLGSAREPVRTARALAGLPRIGAAMSRAELSYAKVRALTRIATPATEECLLEWALHGTAEQLERVVRAARGARETEALDRDRLRRRRRAVSWQVEEDGSLTLRARLPAQSAQVVLKALELAEEELRQEERAAREPCVAVSPQVTPPCESYLAASPQVTPACESYRGPSPQAAAVCEPCPAASPQVTPACEPGAQASPLDAAVRGPASAASPQVASACEPEPDHPLGARRADALERLAEGYLSLLASGQGHRPDHHLVVVHVDAERLAHREEGRCENPDGTALPAETARRHACDGPLLRLTEDGRGQPLDLGRRTRAVPPALRRALQARDRGCRFPGCHHTRHLHAHHLRHWADGGHTRLDTLLSLCSHHHRAVHEGGIGIQRLDDGALRWTGPDGCPLATHRPRPHGRLEQLLVEHELRGLRIDARTGACRWQGDRPDYALAVEALLSMERRWREQHGGAHAGCAGVEQAEDVEGAEVVKNQGPDVPAGTRWSSVRQSRELGQGCHEHHGPDRRGAGQSHEEADPLSAETLWSMPTQPSGLDWGGDEEWDAAPRWAEAEECETDGPEHQERGDFDHVCAGTRWRSVAES